MRPGQLSTDKATLDLGIWTIQGQERFQRKGEDRSWTGLVRKRRGNSRADGSEIGYELKKQRFDGEKCN